GLVPLGYEVRERQLATVESEAETVRHIFQRYCELGSVRLLKGELDRDGSRAGAQSFSRGRHTATPVLLAAWYLNDVAPDLPRGDQGRQVALLCDSSGSGG